MKSLAGHLLIAVPDLPDSNFYRTVVFLVEHSQNGAVGVVLNRPANVALAEIWSELAANVEVGHRDFVHIGGPVRGPLLALHDQFAASESMIIDGVYMTMASEKLNDLIADPNCEFKAFSGYSGWGPGQLESEIERGGWLLHPAEPKHVFCGSESLWREICEAVGNQIMLPVIAKNAVPSDPNLN